MVKYKKITAFVHLYTKMYIIHLVLIRKSGFFHIIHILHFGFKLLPTHLTESRHIHK